MSAIPWATIAGIVGFIWKNRKKIVDYVREHNPWDKTFKVKKQDAVKNTQIDLLIAELGNYYRFNRVTISQFSGFTLRPTILHDYEQLRITITNEWTSNADRVMQEFQDADCASLAKGIMKLDISTTGWIPIPPDEEMTEDLADIIDVQNLYDVVKSYRFKLGDFVTDGSMALSFTHAGPGQELALADLRHIRTVARKIFLIIKTKPK